MESIKLWGAIHLKREGGGYHLIREQGQEAINFVHFLDPVMIRTGRETLHTEANACILYSPGTRQEYYALEHGFVNNFVTFQCDRPDYLRQFNLPVNEVFYIDQPQLITDRVEYISWTMADIDNDHTENVRERIAELLRILSEIRILDTPRARRAYETKKRFLDLRERVAQQPGAWDVEAMARAAYLTRSHFFTLYRKFFELSPSEDLIRMTLDYAKRRLLESQDPIYQISRECGHGRPEYFIRLFKQKTGVTPGQYRKEFRKI